MASRFSPVDFVVEEHVPKPLAEEHWDWLNQFYGVDPNLSLLKYHRFGLRQDNPSVYTAVCRFIQQKKNYWVIDDDKEDYRNHVVILTPISDQDLPKFLAHMEKARPFLASGGSVSFRKYGKEWERISTVYLDP